MNPDLIRKAVVTHFACDHNNLTCDTKLEESVTVAGDFLRYMLTGNATEALTKALGTERYQIKKQLIERYINNYTK